MNTDTEQNRILHLFTDGACSGNPGLGGWAAILMDSQTRKELAKYSGRYRKTTNNRMEIIAVTVGLEKLLELKCEFDYCMVFSDSKYVINTITKGWKRKMNADLWFKLDSIIEKFPKGKLRFCHIPGHDPSNYYHYGNDAADKMAVEAWKNTFPHCSIDFGYESRHQSADFPPCGYLPEPVIKEVRLLNVSQKTERKAEAVLSNGTTVTISPLYEGFQQTGCTKVEAAVTLDLAESLNAWLHGYSL